MPESKSGVLSNHTCHAFGLKRSVYAHAFRHRDMQVASGGTGTYRGEGSTNTIRWSPVDNVISCYVRYLRAQHTCALVHTPSHKYVLGHVFMP